MDRVLFWLFPSQLFRGDWKWGIIILVAALCTLGISTLVFMFIYNKLFVKSLLDSGYTSVDSEELLNPIEAKLRNENPEKILKLENNNICYISFY